MVDGYEPWEVQTFTGIGNQVVRLVPLKSRILLIFQTEPQAGFVCVDGFNGRGEAVMKALVAVDQYNGTTLWGMDPEDPVVALQVTCERGWSLAIRPLSDARTWDARSISGIGDDVMILSQPVSSFTAVTFSTVSEQNTTVWAYSETASNLMVNQVGAGTGDYVLPGGTWLVTVHTDAQWTMTRS